jgi:hypothetical protein
MKTTPMPVLLKSLAKQFLQYKDEKTLARIKSVLSCLEFTTLNKTLKEIGVSYFCGLNSSQKIEKGKKENYDTLVLYLSASRNAGVDVCRFATAGCRLACLVASGHALIEARSKGNTILISRLIKTWVCVYRPDIAEELICSEIIKAKTKASKAKHKFAVRLNGTSDLDFSNIYSGFPTVQFYDYTKDPNRKSRKNYHVTFSYSNASFMRIVHYKQATSKGQKIAFPVIACDFEAALKLPDCFSMDSTDLRFLDKAGNYGLLKAKQTLGNADGEKEGFLLNLEQLKNVINQIES